MDSICEILNANGPWTWQGRENYIYGHYLNCRPRDGWHFRIHEFPQGFVQTPQKEGFSALLRIKEENPTQQEEIDAIFRGLLTKIQATGIQDIEPYD
jgi:hypothetical protein